MNVFPDDGLVRPETRKS